MAKTDKKKSNSKSRRIALMVIVIMVILIAIGEAINFFYFRESFIKPTEQQATTAKSIVSGALQIKGDNLSNYKVIIVENMKKSEDETDRNLLEVFLFNNSTTHSYLIDLDSYSIVMYKETEVYGWMLDYCQKKNNKEESERQIDKDNKAKNLDGSYKRMHRINERCD